MTSPTTSLHTAPFASPSAGAVSAAPVPGWFTPADCRLEDFRPLVEQAAPLDDYPHADAVEQSVLIYGERLRGLAEAGGGTSSAFGRAMESVDTTAICAAVFPALKARAAAGPHRGAVRNLIAVAAEGYLFPTNLDRDQPIGGLAPQSQAQLLTQAVEEDWDVGRLRVELAAQQERRRA
jgi:hypothetical protein